MEVYVSASREICIFEICPTLFRVLYKQDTSSTFETPINLLVKMR